MSLGRVVPSIASTIESVAVSPPFRRILRYAAASIPKSGAVLRLFSVVPMGQSGESKSYGTVLWRDEPRRYSVQIDYPTGFATEDLAILVEDDEARITYALPTKALWTASEIQSLVKVGSVLDTKSAKIWFLTLTLEAHVHYGGS